MNRIQIWRAVAYSTDTYIPCIVYLSVPFSVYPNVLLLPAALLMGLAISVTVGAFKKYL